MSKFTKQYLILISTKKKTNSYTINHFNNIKLFVYATLSILKYVALIHID